MLQERHVLCWSFGICTINMLGAWEHRALLFAWYILWSAGNHMGVKKASRIPLERRECAVTAWLNNWETGTMLSNDIHQAIAMESFAVLFNI